MALKQTGMLRESQAYRDPGLRQKARPLMVSTKNAPLWDALVKASDGDKAGFTEALYFYCERYSVIPNHRRHGTPGGSRSQEAGAS